MEERITTAGIAIKDSKVLVAQRKVGGPLSLMWEFPGGKNRWNETVEDTLKREWQEELGIDISVGEFLLAFDFENNGVIYHLKCHRINLLSFDFSLNVHIALHFADREELLELEFAPSDRKICEFLLEAGIIK